MRLAHIIASAGSLVLLTAAAAWAGDGLDQPGNHVQVQHTRVLAASCAACHGTNGNSVGGTPVLAGLQPQHFSSQMQAFKSGQRASTVMHRHARGLTDQEIFELAEYFHRQPRRVSVLPAAAKPVTRMP